MRKKRVVFYGRVSTSSEEQLSALENQMEWYQELLKSHPEWEVVGVYEDEGKTGTSIKRRKDFKQMMEDGIERHLFDLIVTRETKRFARNTVDTLSWTRKLTEANIDVFLVSDNINTLNSPDGELRLSIMAVLAQEESRKISENVKAGQRISRNKGVLRGNGNILGYNRIKKNEYQINLGQAEIVRKIYEWYIGGKGIRAIKFLLEQEGYLTATGLTRWQEMAIAKILSNPFYIGKQRQLAYISDGYLTQNRVKNSPGSVEYINGEFEPIISVDMFNEVQRIKTERSTNSNLVSCRGVKRSKDIWGRKFTCQCGCGMTKRKGSNSNKYRTTVYLCGSQHKQGKEQYQLERGIVQADVCALESMTSWKVEMIAYNVIKSTWNTGKEDIEQAMNIIKECYMSDEILSYNVKKTILEKKEKLERRKSNLTDMRADGEITKEDFLARIDKCDIEILDLVNRLQSAENEEVGRKDLSNALQSIKDSLEVMLDFSKPEIDHDFLDNVLWRMIHIGQNEFDVYLSMGNDNFGKIGLECKEITYKVFSTVDTVRTESVQCTKLKEIIIDYDMASSYRMISGNKVRKERWNDMKVNVYI